MRPPDPSEYTSDLTVDKGDGVLNSHNSTDISIYAHICHQYQLDLFL